VPTVPNSDTDGTPVRRASLPAAIAERMRLQIQRGELVAGTRLPGHRELAAMYSVSVGSVREAISMLVSSGLVETQAGRGTYVTRALPAAEAPAFAPPLDRDEVRELTEARGVIEAQLAALASERASAEDVAGLRRAVDRMAATSADPAEYPDADVEFHLALARSVRNRYLLKAMLDIRALLRKDMELGAEAAIRRFGSLRPSVESHRRLVDAIEAHDGDSSREIALEIVQRNQKFVLGLYALAGGEAE
jgi:GntR family transcriptional regulator, transcriptional repressor for pyruvate dehydrogenase complex